MQWLAAPSMFECDASRFAPDVRLRACHPINEGSGGAFFVDALAMPLRAAFSKGEERTDIALRGAWKGGDWLARSGHIAGIFAGDLFGIPATDKAAFVRFGRFDRFEDDRLVETILLLDLPALMMQAGVWPLAPPMGDLLIAPGPATHDGVTQERDCGEGIQSLALVEAMIGGLHHFDGSLKSMGMRDFWTDDFWWFGPAPVGNFCGHASYERGHQGPFLTAFPDRQGGNHEARIGERNYIASTGWPSIRATHEGGGWLGLAPTARPVTMRVMDFWRRDPARNRLAENWVMIDIPDLLLQMGIDVFERMHALLPLPRGR